MILKQVRDKSVDGRAKTPVNRPWAEPRSPAPGAEMGALPVAAAGAAVSGKRVTCALSRLLTCDAYEPSDKPPLHSEAGRRACRRASRVRVLPLWERRAQHHPGIWAIAARGWSEERAQALC